MSSEETNAGWSGFNGTKILEEKPDALMEDINKAIAAMEYARATVLLKLSTSSSLSKTKNTSSQSNAASMYDSCILEEAYRIGCKLK